MPNQYLTRWQHSVAAHSLCFEPIAKYVTVLSTDITNDEQVQTKQHGISLVMNKELKRANLIMKQEYKNQVSNLQQ